MRWPTRRSGARTAALVPFTRGSYPNTADLVVRANESPQPRLTGAPHVARRKKLPNLKTAYSGLASQLVAIEKRTAGVKRDCEQYEKEAQAAIAGLEQKKRQCIDGLATEARELLGQFEAELDTIALRAEKHNRKLKKKRKATAAQAKLLIQQLEQATRGSPLYDDDEDDDSLV